MQILFLGGPKIIFFGRGGGSIFFGFFNYFFFFFLICGFLQDKDEKEEESLTEATESVITENRIIYERGAERQYNMRF